MLNRLWNYPVKVISSSFPLVYSHHYFCVSKINTGQGISYQNPCLVFSFWSNTVLKVKNDAVGVCCCSFLYESRFVPGRIKSASPWAVFVVNCPLSRRGQGKKVVSQFAANGGFKPGCGHPWGGTAVMGYCGSRRDFKPFSSVAHSFFLF